MLFSRRFGTFPERAIQSFENLRHPRALAAALLGATLGLTACDPGETGDEPEQEVDAVEVTVTAAMDAVEGGSGAVAFVPNADTPWAGLIVSAPLDGGLDIFNVDGEALERVTGPRLNSLAVSPGFALRGESLPLIVGVETATGAVRGYVLLRSEPTAVEAPLAPIEPEGGASAVCFIEEAPGHLDIAVLGREARVTTWRIRDTGGDLIGAEQTGSYALPAPARTCASFQDELYVAGPTLSVTRISPSGMSEARGVPSAEGLTAGLLLGRPVVIAAGGTTGGLAILDGRDLSLLQNIRIVDGMSTPGVEQAVSVTMSTESYGGTAYQSGIVAVVDGADNRIRFIARETFARALSPNAGPDSLGG